uniref:Uncharacterized protein n=1 Tax=mine drainage metagenome TaxID=410659 RepID=E6QPB9_9ZZZZ
MIDPVLAAALEIRARAFGNAFVRRVWASRSARGAFLIGSAFLVAIVAIGAPRIARGYALDTLQSNINSMGTTIMGGADGLISGILLALVGSVMLYRLGMAGYVTRSVRGVLDEGMRALFEVGLPFALISALYPLITNGATLAYTVFAGVGIPAVPTSPETILQRGIGIGFGIFSAFIKTMTTAGPAAPAGLPWWQAIVNFIAVLPDMLIEGVLGFVFIVVIFICACVIAYCFAMLAAELLLAKVQAAITLPFAKLLLPFHIGPLGGLGSSGLGAVLAILIRYAVIAIMVGIVMTTSVAWQADATTAALAFNSLPNLYTNTGTINQNYLSAMGATSLNVTKAMLSFVFAAFILKYIVSQVGQLADAVMTGRSVFSGGMAVQAAAAPIDRAGGAIAGGMTGGVPGAAYGAMGGTKSVLSSYMIARMRSRGAGSGGVGGSPSSGGGSGRGSSGPSSSSGASSPRSGGPGQSRGPDVTLGEPPVPPVL